MKTKCVSKRCVIIVNTILILSSTMLAIITHSLLPASVDVTQFDSIFVRLFGFPAVVVFYFLLLFTQCAITITYIGIKANVAKLQIGIRFGIAFAMLYLVGMQEVVIKGSSFSSWGLEFVKYQFIIGIGDGIPVILLCLGVAFFALSDNKRIKVIDKLQLTKSIKSIFVIAITIFIGRTIGYESGLISSESSTYPIPCYMWTGCFGLLMGYIYVILYPLLTFKKKQYHIPLRLIGAIGVNWIIFNFFIGLIMNGAIPQVILRSGLDVMMLFIASTLITKKSINEREGR